MNDEDDKQGLLDFLTDNLFGRERDAVTRAIYEYASGDPRSYPMGMAVLLTACARQMAGLPKNLRGIATDLRKFSEEVAQLQTDLLDKLTRENFSTFSAQKKEGERILANFKEENGNIISAFKQENSRTMELWANTINEAREVSNRASEIRQDLKPIVTLAQQVVKDFQTLQGDLKVHAESAATMAEGVEALKLLHQQDLALHQQSEAHMTALSRQARADYSLMGFLVGIILAAIFLQIGAPGWINLIMVLVGIVVFRWLSTVNWKSKKKDKDTTLPPPPVEPKPVS